jgi:hypothetical protein
MNLTEAFKRAVQKYYEGYDYEHSKKIGNSDKEFEYDFQKLDELQKGAKKKTRKPSVKADLPDMEDDPMDDEASEFDEEEEEIE